MQTHSTSPLELFAQRLGQLAIVLAAGMVIALVVVVVMRRRGLAWSWTIPAVLVAVPAWSIDHTGAVVWGALTGLTTLLGARWHFDDLKHGADLAARARSRRGLQHAAAGVGARRALRRGQWVSDQGVLVGRDERRRAVRIACAPGCHTLVVGATGSGKTVTQAWIAGRLIEHGWGAIVIDPKGDRLLRDELHDAAKRAGRPFWEWTPRGPGAYNPLGRGSASEIADKALAGETYTEPHYLRQAQRYLAWAVRTLQGIGYPVTLATLTDALDPRHLERFSRALPDDERITVHSYLDSLTAEQARGLTGTRDRLAILAESDVARWLYRDHATGHTIDLVDAVRERGVVYFGLDADRRPLLAQMLATAIVQDLITVAARHQTQPIPTVVLIDEFSAIAPDRVARLFGRARSAAITMLLGTQELADLRPREHPALADQVLGNIATLIAHRQTVPESAETIAAIAGTHGTWITTQRTDGLATPADAGTRTRGREYRLHPDQIKALPTATAAVISPGNGAEPRITRILHPREARR